MPTSAISSFLLLLLLLFLRSPCATADPIFQNCGQTGNYTAGSTYESNLHRLLPSLTANGSRSGFSTAAVGQSPDRVYGLVLCRGDTDAGNCSSCLGTAAQDILQVCPYSKDASVWYDPCLLRFSNQDFLSTPASDPVGFSSEDPILDPDRFDELLDELMNKISDCAAYNSTRRFATGEANSTPPSLPTIYGLVQCTPDLSGAQCWQCLQVVMDQLEISIYGRRGGATFGVRCNLRYELYPFFDGAPTIRLTSLLALAPAPPQLRPLNPAGEGGKKRKVIIVVIVIPSLGALIFLFAFFTCFSRRTSAMLFKSGDEEKKDAKSLLFDFDDLRVATNNFSNTNKLGEGGFGPVYKGVLSDGQEIAVKRLSTSSRQGIQQLKNEVIFVAKLQHRNLVRLLGCCLQKHEKLLVYEYVQNTSLDKFLLDPIRRGQLTWGRRYKIIEGIARGLQYLHEDSRFKIIHRDLKTSNILLDQDMNPKISDFGLAKLFDVDATHGRASQIAGTYGYMAPEYAMHGQFSTKSDVFSYGVLVLEIVTGRGISDFHGSGRDANLLSYMWKHWNKGKALQALDKSLGRKFHKQEALRCIHIGLLCVQEDSRKRPSMGTIFLMLSSYTGTLPTPSIPAFFVEGSSTGKIEVATRDCDCNLERNERSDRKKTTSSSLFINDVTISAIEPR